MLVRFLLARSFFIQVLTKSFMRRFFKPYQASCQVWEIWVDLILYLQLFAMLFSFDLHGEVHEIYSENHFKMEIMSQEQVMNNFWPSLITHSFNVTQITFDFKLCFIFLQRLNSLCLYTELKSVWTLVQQHHPQFLFL